MIKRTVFLIFTCCALQSQAQSTFNIGPVYSGGASTILMKSMEGMHTGGKMSMKINVGAGLKAEYFFKEKWGMFLQTGFQQRGALFKEYIDDFKPRYRLNYWDAILGGSFRTKCIMNDKQQFTINLGLSQHTLLEANRVYDTGSDYIKNEFKKVDVGLFLGIGGNIPINGKDIFQVQLFANPGFMQVFSGNLAMNGMRGTNFLTGIQIAYLIGKSEKKE